MKNILLVFLVLGGLSLTACAVRTPGGSIIVDPDGRHDNGRFCPPGQAKKGNC